MRAIVLSVLLGLVVGDMANGEDLRSPATSFNVPDSEPVGAVLSSDSTQLQDLQLRVDWLEQRLGEYESAPVHEGHGAWFPAVEFHGRLYCDWAWFDQDAANMATVGDIQDGGDFRTARLSGQGQLYENIWCEVEVDFAEAGDAPQFKDVWMAITDLPLLGNAKIGHFKEPFSLEELVSSRFSTFMERGLPTVFVPGRSLGFSAYDCSANERITWAVGGFRTGADDFGNAVSDHGEWAVTARATALPLYAEDGRRLIHLGGAYSYRQPDENELRFRSRPEIKIKSEDDKVPYFVNTGKFDVVEYHLLGAETALVHGPFSIQSEFIAASVNQIGGPDLYFYGAYAYLSYFLTGESRPYDRNTGEFGRVRPFEDFVRGGRGAWELAARWSYIELNDLGIEGGRLQNATVGVNWHLNPYARVMCNYIHAALDDFDDSDSDADILAMRFQVDF